MTSFYWDALLHFESVDCSEDGETLPDRVDAHIFERLVVQVDENLSRDAVVWR